MDDPRDRHERSPRSASEETIGADAPPTPTFEAYLRRGMLALQRCATSGRFVFYPRVMAPGSGGRELAWVEVSGLGTVYATTVVRRRPARGGPYNVALVDLDEGARLMSRIEGIPPDRVRIGMRVRAIVTRDEGRELVVFRPQAVP
jgi:hypothetical protein